MKDWKQQILLWGENYLLMLFKLFIIGTENWPDFLELTISLYDWLVPFRAIWGEAAIKQPSSSQQAEGERAGEKSTWPRCVPSDLLPLTQNFPVVHSAVTHQRVNTLMKLVSLQFSHFWKVHLGSVWAFCEHLESNQHVCIQNTSKWFSKALKYRKCQTN